jgi:hypothetical protein
MRCSAPADGSGPDDANLRSALRHVPVLPPLSNIKELVARVEQQAPAHSSADLDEIILDARYPDMPGELGYDEQEQEEKASFFEPISRTANSNVPSSPPRRTFRFAGLILGLVIVCGGALLVWQRTIPAGEDRSPFPTPTLEATEIEYSGIISFEGPEKSNGPKSEGLTPEADLRPADLSERGLEPPERDHARSQTTLDNSQLRESDEAADSVQQAKRESAEAPTLATESLRELIEAMIAADSAAIAPAQKDRAERPTLAKESLRALIATVAETKPKSKTTTPELVGRWATSPNACNSGGQRRGSLLTYISTRGARAGNTSCTFTTDEGRAGLPTR